MTPLKTSTSKTARSWRALSLAAATALIALAGCDRSAPTTQSQAKPIATQAATVPAAAHSPAPANEPIADSTPNAQSARPKPITLSGGASSGGNVKNMTAARMEADVQGANPATPAPALPAATPAAIPADAPKLVLDKSFIDFGTVYKDDPVTSTVTYKNDGKSPLTNIEFRPSCGCTVVQGYKTLLQPGESSTVDITFNPKGHPGKNSKSVNVMSSDPLQPQTLIRFECNYVPLVQLSPPVIQFGTVVAGNEGKALLTVTSRDEKFEVVSIDTGNSLIKCEASDDDVPSEDPNYPGRKVLEFILDKNAPTGSVSSTAKIKIKARPEPANAASEQQELEMTASIIAHVLGDMVIEPRFIRVAQAYPGQKFSEKVLVTSASGKLFNITSATVVESTLPGVTARTEPIKDASIKGHYLILEGTGGETLGMFRGYIEVKSDLPNESAIRVQFNGFTREAPKTENQ